MPVYDAGESRGKYGLDISPLEAAISRAKALYGELGAAAAASGATSGGGLDKQAGDAAKAAAAVQKLATEQQKTLAAAASASAAQQRLATEEQHTAAAASAAAAAAQKLNTEQQRTAKEAANAEAALARQTKAELALALAKDRANKPRPSTPPPPPPAGEKNQPISFNQALSAFGLATIGPQLVGQAINQGIDAAKSAVELRETKNALAAVAGDTKTYSLILGEARKQQLLFGGSLQENVEGLSGLAVTSRNTGAKLSQLIDIQKRLVVLNPAQGAQGGLIALNEALAGNLSSLSRRFNIPREALKALNDQTLPVAERLKVIDGFLTGVGITSEAVAGKVDQDALAFRRLAQELDAAKNNAGSGLASTFSGAATGLSRLVGLINSNPQAIAEIKALLGKATGGSGVVDTAAIDQVRRAQATSAADRAVAPLDTPFNPLASEKTRQQPDQLKASIEAGQENQAAVAKLRDQLIELGLADEGTADKAAKFSEQLRSGAIDAQTFVAQIQALSDQQNFATDAEDRRAKALDALEDAQDKVLQGTIDDIAKKNEAAIAAGKVADVETTIAQIGAQVRQGLITSAEGAGILANALHLTSSEAADLIAKLGQVAGLKAPSGSAAASSQLPRDLQISAANTTKLANADLVRRDRILQTGTAQQKLALAQEDAAKAARDFGKDSVEAGLAQNKVLAEQQAIAKANTRGGGKGLSALDKSEINLAGDLQDQLDAVNQELAKGNLTQLQRNQLLEKQQSLESKINDELERRTTANINAQLDSVKDAQAKLKEAREAAGLERQLQSNRFSGSQQEAARLRLREIALEQAKRENDIAKETKDAGGVLRPVGNAPAPQATTPRGGAPLPQPLAITQPLPLPNLAPLPPSLPPQVNLSLTIQIDPTTGAATVVNAPPNINLLDVLVKAAVKG